DCNSEAAKRYAYLAQSLGLPAQTVKEGVISLIANALLMTHVIAFNANLHGDCNSEAAKRYAYLAQSLGLPAQTVKEGVISLI
ncbi:hypothetical protein BUE67_15890, partial [Corynebacterium diphtheriae]